MPVLMALLTAQLTWSPLVAMSAPAGAPASQTAVVVSAVTGIVRDGAEDDGAALKERGPTGPYPMQCRVRVDKEALSLVLHVALWLLR